MGNIPIPTSHYSFAELADIYNQARVDYIVPMPMNAKRMEDYVRTYDIDLNLSLVAIDREDEHPNGICMFGVRADRGWITRLGVIPERRRRKTGEFLMRQLIDVARQRQMRLIQLEVIKGNEPAYQLFQKLGFVDTRELLIIRRPPGKLKPEQLPPDNLLVSPVEDVAGVLADRDGEPSWVEETQSLLNAGNIQGFKITMAEGDSSWLIFQKATFQLTHFVFAPQSSPELLRALLGKVHQDFPLVDTKIENIPANDMAWGIYQEMGYVESFRRVEMVLTL
jgi:ribosomal protein S18 acetylase RimI-like enzyme